MAEVNVPVYDDVYGITKTIVTNKYRPYEGMPPFLIEGVLHDTLTLFYGEAKSGKSTLAAALVAALLNNETEFLGKAVTGKVDNVGIIAGDFGDDKAYGDQLSRVMADGAKVTIYGLDRPPEARHWDGLAIEAQKAGHDLVVVDNLTSFIDGSLNEDQAVKRIYDHLDRFVRNSTAVLLVAHSSEKTGEHGKSRYPLGSSGIRAGARWLCRVERTSADSLKLHFEGNYAAEHDIIVSPPEGRAEFKVLDTVGPDELTAKRRLRDKLKLARQQAIADYVVTSCQGLSGRQAGAAIVAQGFGGTEGSHAVSLSQGRYGVRKDSLSGQWVKVA